jgi:hypothetical protein
LVLIVGLLTPNLFFLVVISLHLSIKKKLK